MLHLVGETIDKHRAQYGVASGRLVQIMRGIYVAADDDADEVLFDHALRVAAYLYPNTYLCGASAELLSATADRRLFLSGTRNARTRLRGLEVVQTRAPYAPETETFETSDPTGELRGRRSSLRFRFLESFRTRVEAAAAMSIDMRSDIATRLVESVGDRNAAVIECWRLAESNGWRKEAGRAQAFLTQPLRETLMNRTVFHVGWHGQEIGALSHDGSMWHWEPIDSKSPTPVSTGTVGRLPPFVEGLLAEGWLEQVLKSKSDRERLSAGKRYMSNIVISVDANDLTTLPDDVLEGRLDQYTVEGRFVGGYAGPAPMIDTSLESRIADLYTSMATPRLSGVQIKAPMNLAHDGTLRSAEDRAFTHILKPWTGAGFEDLPLVEAACLSAARACGFETAEHAVIAMPADLPDALLVERFDIRRDQSDRRRIALEDMASIRGVSPEGKYTGSIEQVARALRGVSSDAEADILVLLARSVFAWLIADGDFHLKNMAVLRVIPYGAESFASVRFAPTYDIVTTRVFPGLENDDLALALAGKRDRLSMKDFVRAGVTMGIAAEVAQELVASLCDRLSEHLGEVESASDRVNRAHEIWKERIETIR